MSASQEAYWTLVLYHTSNGRKAQQRLRVNFVPNEELPEGSHDVAAVSRWMASSRTVDTEASRGGSSPVQAFTCTSPEIEDTAGDSRSSTEAPSQPVATEATYASNSARQNICDIIDRKLVGILSPRSDNGLEQIRRCFTATSGSDACSGTLLAMWEQMKRSSEPLCNIIKATSNHGKLCVGEARVRKWVGDFLTGFATYYACTHKGEPVKPSRAFDRWLQSIFRIVRVASNLTETVGVASLTIFTSIALSDHRLAILGRQPMSQVGLLLEELSMDMGKKLRELVSTAPRRSGDDKMIPLLNPVAFAAWMCEESYALVCERLDLPGFTALPERLWMDIRLVEVENAILGKLALLTQPSAAHESHSPAANELLRDVRSSADVPAAACGHECTARSPQGLGPRQAGIDRSQSAIPTTIQHECAGVQSG
ncbi:hypothetical protein Purlil1_14250 [Purpureocillium lilacinum]|uniref:Uncharacterized protein n=1 Tax=Purpureocillium lilacinum TaxID=33203 RepID=A0ABR0BBS5_PURLI|nr:hypothetical protein Purlil1_14250 [Purpureocillium lilacinum]